MNNYTDYYNYLNSYDNINFMPHNNIIPNLNYPNNIQNNNILDSKEGFIKGNMFNNLYEPYKNYKPVELKAKNEKEDMIMGLDEYRFALIDLGLHLDIYPNDTNAINLFNKYLNKEKELKRLYESKYGPLTISNQIQNNYAWIKSPWPWEEIK